MAQYRHERNIWRQKNGCPHCIRCIRLQAVGRGTGILGVLKDLGNTNFVCLSALSS